MYLIEKKGEKLTKLEFVLDDLLSYCKGKGYALAVWRLPASDETHVIIANKVQNIYHQEIESLPFGFLVGAFHSVIDKKKFFLPADYYFHFNEGGQAAFVDSLINSLPDFATFQSEGQQDAPLPEQLPISPENFIGIVQEAVREMEMGSVKKIVLARRKMVELPKEFSFHALEQIATITLSNVASYSYSHVSHHGSSFI